MKKYKLLSLLKAVLLFVLGGALMSSAFPENECSFDKAFSMIANTTSDYFFTNNQEGDTVSPQSGASQRLKSSGTSSIVVRLNPLPVTNIVGDTIVCQGETAAYTVSDSMSSYVWTVTGGTINGSSNDDSVFVTWNTAGTHTLQVGYTDSNSCFNSSTIVIKVNGHAVDTNIFADNDTVCFEAPAVLTVSSNVSNAQFKWYTNADRTGFIVDGNTFTTGILTNDTVFYVSMSSDTLCENQANDLKAVSVKVNNKPTFVSCSGNIVEYKKGNDTTVTYIVTASGSPSPAITYEFSGATTGTGTGTGSGSSFEDGITTVKVFATNSCGIDSCMFTVTVRDTVSPCDVSATLSGDNSICEGTSAILTINFTGTAPWNVTYTNGTNQYNLTNITQNPYTFTVTPSTTTLYSLTKVSNAICEGDIYGTATVIVNPYPLLPLLQISGDTLIDKGSSTILTVLTPVNGSIRWYSDPLYNSLLHQGRSYITPLIYTNTTYYLRLLSTQGCESNNSQSVSVKIKDLQVVVPEAITPNGDGANDELIIKGIENYPNNTLLIYNRWSDLVWEGKGYNNKNIKWTGYSNKKLVVGEGKVPVGTYFYILELNDNQKTVLKGFIEVRY